MATISMSLYVHRADGTISEPHEVFSAEEASEEIANGRFEDVPTLAGDRIWLQDGNGKVLELEEDGTWTKVTK